MDPVTIIFLSVLVILLVAGMVGAAVDLSKIGAKALDLRRARRACSRGWDWPAFEREFASYATGRRTQRSAAHRRR